jgi:UDP-glucose 4-epimerase
VRVLVTGGTGYLGRAVTRELVAHGHTVTVLSRGNRRVELPPGVHAVVADLQDAEAVRQTVADNPCDAAVHLAGRTNARESFSHPLGYYATNVTGTLNLLTALDKMAADTGIRHGVVFASTNAVYGSQAEDRISETATPHPESPYAASKLAAEQLIEFHARTGAIGAVILRCFNIAGAVDGITDPDLTRIIPRILHAAATGQSVPVNGDGSTQRDFVHIADVATAVRLAAEAATTGTPKTYNVGTGEGTAIRDIITAAEKLCGRRITVEHRPPAREPHTAVADTSLIRTELGWRPSRRSTITQILIPFAPR